MKIEKKRYYDLDWLRVLGMAGIFLFHNARFFNDEDWHVKNNVLDFGMSVFVSILNQFIMPLFLYFLRWQFITRSNSERVGSLCASV